MALIGQAKDAVQRLVKELYANALQTIIMAAADCMVGQAPDQKPRKVVLESQRRTLFTESSPKTSLKRGERTLKKGEKSLKSFARWNASWLLAVYSISGGGATSHHRLLNSREVQRPC